MNFPVSEKKLSNLRERMEKLGLREQDLEERFVKGSGHGGQKINKTSSAVWLKDHKSGIEVKCQESRQQSLNRFLARRLLVEKLEAKQTTQIFSEQQEIAKIRRQKRKRSKRAKEKILKNKKEHAQKKQLRRKPDL